MHNRITFAAQLLFPIVLALVAQTGAAESVERPLALSIAGNPIVAEVMATPEGRQRGLMFREKLGNNDGMLFVFDHLGYHGMWMRNTLIPLSVAFMDDAGKILNVEEMEPRSEITHSAAGPARYALEMNAGWFSAHGIKAGTLVKGLEKAPPGR